MFELDLIPDDRFAIAFSGGGDSTALVHRLRGRNPLVLIVDHGLRSKSAQEARAAAAFARGLGLETRILNWVHDHPKTGVQEKARLARYGLLGRACREENIRHLLTAHTRDDQAETLLMRYDRGTDWRGAVGMRASAYGPVWPQLARINLVRPLLGIRRETLRAYNREHGLAWIEDPSNQDRSFTRIRARDYLATRPELTQFLLDTAEALQVGLSEEREKFGRFCRDFIEIDKFGLFHMTHVPLPHLLGQLCRIASGTGGTIERGKLSRLHHELKRGGFVSATLADALVVRSEQGLIIGPDPVVYKGRGNKAGIAPVQLNAYQPIIWGGRFCLSSHQDGLTVYPLGGRMKYLSESQRECLKPMPAEFRGSLPVILNGEGHVMGCPGAALHPDIDIDGLVSERLHALSK